MCSCGFLSLLFFWFDWLYLCMVGFLDVSCVVSHISHISHLVSISQVPSQMENLKCAIVSLPFLMSRLSGWGMASAW